MRQQVGATFVTGGSVSTGKELTFYYPRGYAQPPYDRHQRCWRNRNERDHGPTSPGIDEKERADARELGKRVARAAALVKRESSVLSLKFI